MQSFKYSRQLSGLSGTQVFLLSNSGKAWFVRKIATNKENSGRLILQKEKQEFFYKNRIIDVPKVINCGYLGNFFYFDQNYIAGKDAAEYLTFCNYRQLEDYADRLVNYFEKIKNITNEEIDVYEVLKNKIDQLQIDLELKTIFIKNLSTIKGVKLPKTLCAGDFTLENQIINNRGKIFAIDFLNPPFEHYYFDLAKLEQGLTENWASCREINIPPEKAQYIIKKIKDKEYIRTDVYEIILSMNFLRILPYLKYAASFEKEKIIKIVMKYLKK